MTLLIIAVLMQGAPITPPATAAGAPVAKDADKQICRWDVPVGSILPGKKTCHTKLEWQQIAAGTAAYSDGVLSRRLTNGAGVQIDN